MASLKYEANSSFQTGTLASSYTSGGGSLSLTSGHGARFPSAADFWVRVDSEVFRVTARTGDTLTVTGAADGTSAANHSAGATVRWILGVAALNQLKLDIGSMVILAEQTASSSAALDFSTTGGFPWYDSAFDVYEVQLINVRPATDGTNLKLTVSVDAGANYLTTTIYGNSNFVMRAGGSSVGGAESGAASIDLTAWNVENTAADGGICARLNLYNPGSTVVHKVIEGQVCFRDNAGFYLHVPFRGTAGTASAVNGLRFAFASGDIADGTIRIYGIRS